MDSQYIGLASGALNLISAVPYVYAIIKGKARPNRVTWIVWTFLAWTIGFVAALLNVLAIDAMRLVIIVQPIVVVIWHVMILVPLYDAKNQKKIM